jgi:transcriptional regulator with XRE-family HTH domain
MERIRELRKEQGLSQAKLAVMADMDPATLNRLERGTGNPNLKTLARVADVLGVEVADLFPKAERRSSPEPSLFNGLEGERHDHDFLRARNSLDRFCGYWDERLAGGDITRREFEDLGAVINCWVPILFETLAAERNELLAAGKAGDVSSSVIWPAVERFLALGDRLGKLEHDLYGADKDAEKRRGSFEVLEGMRSTG